MGQENINSPINSLNMDFDFWPVTMKFQILLYSRDVTNEYLSFNKILFLKF